MFYPLGAVFLLLVTGCGPSYLEQRTDEAQTAGDVMSHADLRPAFPRRSISNFARQMGDSSGGFTQFGAQTSTDATLNGSSSKSKTENTPEIVEKDAFLLNFENSPVTDVVKTVLGDILSMRYTIDPRAQATINMFSSRPIARRDLLFVLESALRANGLALIRETGGYRITTLIDGASYGASDHADSANATSPGYGMTIIPLRYVAGTTIVRLIEGFSTRPGTVRADPTGRLMLVTGTGEERRAALETVRQFDVDWLRNQSVGLYPIHNGTSTVIASELERIMDSGEAGMGHGLVKLQDVTPQNAVLVVASEPRWLAIARRWIERLDSPNLSSVSVHVYKVRYGDAKQVAQLLNAMFGSGESDVSQLAPGAAARTLSANDRLTGGQRQSTAPSFAGAASGPSTPPIASVIPAGSATNLPFGGSGSAALKSAFADSAQGNGAALTMGVRITADTENNTLLIYAGAEQFHTIERAVQQIDRPRAQVAIDVTIAEVTLNESLNYGVQFYLANHLGAVTNSTTGQSITNADAPAGLNIFVGGYATPRVIINALHQLTDVKILSNPSLVVTDNQEATLEVGDQVPVSTGSATVLSANNAVVNTIDYKNTGIILDVIPRVSPDDTVQLDISQEISNVVENSATSSSTASRADAGSATTPTISERKVKSNLTVTSGQMVMLAGLVQETQTKSRSGVPGLDQLPIIGGAFGSTGNVRQRTELLILIKPQIIRDSVDASRVAEELRAKMRGGRIDAQSLPNALQVGAKAIPLQ